MKSKMFEIDKTTKVLVALDYSSMDDHIIKYLHFLRQFYNSFDIQFVHVIPNHLNDHSKSDLRVNKMTTIIRELLWNKVHSFFVNQEECKDICIKVLEGAPYRVINDLIKSENIDLLITGKKDKSEGSGITPRRVANNSTCNVLFVPEKATESIDRVMTSIDFSENSARAIEKALELKQTHPSTNLYSVHIVSAQMDKYNTTGTSDEDHSVVLMDTAKRDYQWFLQKYNIEDDAITPIFVKDDQGNIAKELAQYAFREKMDMVIIGARGQNLNDSFLYGRVVERFVEYCHRTPILVVR